MLVELESFCNLKFPSRAMRTEVRLACGFLSTLMRQNRKITDQQLDVFRTKLEELLCARYKEHWHPQNPLLGSGYRCIRINHNCDPLIAEAALASGVAKYGDLKLPEEFTLWVDPSDVSYRIGENGSICKLNDESSSLSTKSPSKEAKESASEETCRKRKIVTNSNFHHHHQNYQYAATACAQC